MPQSCNLLPAFLAGAWAAVLIGLFSLGAAYCVGGLRHEPCDGKHSPGGKVAVGEKRRRTANWLGLLAPRQRTMEVVVGGRYSGIRKLKMDRTKGVWSTIIAGGLIILLVAGTFTMILSETGQPWETLMRKLRR